MPKAELWCLCTTGIKTTYSYMGCRKNGPVPTRMRAIPPWCILVVLVVVSQPTFAQYSEDYVDIPLFHVGMDATYKDCEALQQRVSRRATERERAHSTCPRNTASHRPPCPISGSGPTGKQTGVSFRSVALPTVSAVS